jgi:hypothetical protein
MNKTIVALCLGLALAVAADAASARARHQRHADPAPHSRINSGWGPPMTWDEIEISIPTGG